MIYKVIAFLLISGVAAIKRPIYGGIAGMIAAPAISIVFYSFDLPTVLVLSGFGFWLWVNVGNFYLGLISW